MENYEDIEQLAKLYAKGHITEEEYLSQKKALLEAAVKASQACEISRKNGLIYVVLAWFLGVFGAHNFYAGYNGRGLAQLLLTVFSWILMFIPLIITSIWAFIEMLIVNKDSDGCKFGGDAGLILGLRIAAVIWVAITYFGMLGWITYQNWSINMMM